MDAENDDSIQKKGRHRKKQLFNTILQQMEFYFSDSNLSKDRYLSQLIQENPYVDLSQFLKFNKIRKLTSNIEDLRRAVSKSELLELSEDLNTIRRITALKVNENVDSCTIYVEGISSDTNHEFLSGIFSDFGKVAYVSIPKYKHNSLNKGFAFVEFEDEKDAVNAVTYFENIGSKMSSNINPEDLCSISSFVKENLVNNEETESISIESENKSSGQKRKHSSEEADRKKLKSEDVSKDEDIIYSEDCDAKKKKKKDHKKKNLIKELGLQVLSKLEWKKMRNGYLNLQRKKMKEIKRHLHEYKSSKNQESENSQTKTPATEITEVPPLKLEFAPGLIVKVKLNEPCQSDKKIKMEINNAAKNVKYVDVPFPSGSEEVFVRFSTCEDAQKFCSGEFSGTKNILEGNEEKEYWKKIENDRQIKFQKSKKKQRGKDKLLKKAEKHLAKHTRFDENE